MIDTIAVNFPVELSEEYLAHWLYTRTDEFPDIKIMAYKKNIPIDGATIRAKYNPPNKRFPKPRLNFEVSLPKAVYGNNITQFTDIAEVHAAAVSVNEMIRKDPGFPEVDIRNGKLSRADLCYNHLVGVNVQSYLQAFSLLNYPHRKTSSYLGEGVLYKSKCVSTKFYDKQRESKSSRAAGILRQETTIRSHSYIARQMRIDSPTLKDITREWITEMLKKDLDRLGLSEQKILSKDSVHERLDSKYRPNKGDRLYGYFINQLSMTRQEMLDHGYSPDMIQRNSKHIIDAGIALTQADTRHPLPELQIEWSGPQNLRQSIK